MTFYCNNGGTLFTVSGDEIIGSNGRSYRYDGDVLYDQCGHVVSYHVKNMNMAIGIVAGLHGGIRP